ncbi:hypothetical protein, partial [Streptomyces sp. SD15]
MDELNALGVPEARKSPGEAAGAGDHPARAEATAHTERAASSGSCMPATIQAKPVPRQPAHRV